MAEASKFWIENDDLQRQLLGYETNVYFTDLKSIFNDTRQND